ATPRKKQPGHTRPPSPLIFRVGWQCFGHCRPLLEKGSDTLARCGGTPQETSVSQFPQARITALRLFKVGCGNWLRLSRRSSAYRRVGPDLQGDEHLPPHAPSSLPQAPFP